MIYAILSCCYAEKSFAHGQSLTAEEVDLDIVDYISRSESQRPPFPESRAPIHID